MVLSMDRWRGKVAIVTGASVGIGAAIVQQLVEEGLQVVGLARRVDVIEELAQKLHGKKGKLYAVKADMSKEEDILTAINWVKENLGCAHILINNAGLSKHNTLIGGDPKKWKEVFDVNVMGLCVATGAVSKDMIDNNINGHIIHINSIAGHTVYNMPGTNCYSASKYAVTALAETLRNEINGLQSKIKITSVSPGAVKTDFAKTSGRLDDPVLKERMDKLPKLLAEDCADAVLYALSTPPHVQISEITIKPVGEPF